MVGVFNIISIAFIALFVGLGVDFGIQFSVRYRSERHRNDDLADALAATGRGVGIPAGSGRRRDRGRVLLVPAHHLHRCRRSWARSPASA